MRGSAFGVFVIGKASKNRWDDDDDNYDDGYRGRNRDDDDDDY